MPARATRKYTRKPRKYTKKGKKPTVSKAVKQYVKRAMPAIEFKENWYHDNEVQLNTLTQGAMQGYPQVSVGNSHITRIGNEISLKSFQVKGVLNNNSGSESFARLLILGHDGNIDPNFATFPIFRNTSSGTTTTISSVNGLDCMYYPINKLDCKVYYDKVFRLAGAATGNAAGNTRMFSHFIKFPGKGKRIKYEATGTGVTNQNTFISVYWIVADANDDTTTGTTVELSQLTRFWYTDC